MIITAAQAKWLKLFLHEPDYQTMTRTQELNELELAGFITVTPGGTTWGGHHDFCFNITGDGKLVLREYLKRELAEADWEMNASMACLKASLNGPWTEAAVLRMQVKPDLFADFLLAGGDPKSWNRQTMADLLPIGTKICKINGSAFRTKEKVATVCGHLEELPQWKPANPKGDPLGRSAKRGPPKAYIIEDGSYIAVDRVEKLEGE